MTECYRALGGSLKNANRMMRYLLVGAILLAIMSLIQDIRVENGNFEELRSKPVTRASRLNAKSPSNVKPPNVKKKNNDNSISVDNPVVQIPERSSNVKPPGGKKENKGKPTTVPKLMVRKAVESHPTILVWTAPIYMMEDNELFLEFPSPVECGSCRFTADRSVLEESIAVILFNDHVTLRKFDLPDPKTRRPDQPYVFWTRDVQSKTASFRDALEHPIYDSIFNLTMGFTRASDVRRYFGSYRLALEISKALDLSTTRRSSIMKTKTKLATWVVSNCYKLPGATERMLYAKALVKAGMPLDKFGECFDGERNASLLVTMVSQYKFYLAFENSLHCPDYVTEKFWRNGLKAGLVPVVWGPTKEDLLAVAPPNSFIHTDDFATPKALANYLMYLDRNDTAYLEYHKWRDVPLRTLPPYEFGDTRGHQQEFCGLCRRLVYEKHPPKTYPSISKWLYETGYVDDKCLRPFSNLTKEEQADVLKF